METPICPACGCSLIRLGISQEKAISHYYKENKYWFCCKGCLELFKAQPKHVLNETSNLAVCPVCLAEKPVNNTIKHRFNGTIFNFCRCPHCLDVFKEDQDYFIRRLAWQTDYAGIFGGQDGCCKKNNSNRIQE